MTPFTNMSYIDQCTFISADPCPSLFQGSGGAWTSFGVEPAFLGSCGRYSKVSKTANHPSNPSWELQILPVHTAAGFAVRLHFGWPTLWARPPLAIATQALFLWGSNGFQDRPSPSRQFIFCRHCIFRAARLGPGNEDALDINASPQQAATTNNSSDHDNHTNQVL